MSWQQRQRLKAFLKASLWTVPVASMLAAMIVAPLTRWLNDAFPLFYLNFGLQGARAAIGVIAAAMLTLIVFFFSVLLLTVQIASATLTPRIIARPFQASTLKISLSLFVFTFVYATSVLGRLEDRILQLPVFLTLLLSIASIGVFLFVVERVGKELRPITVVAAVAREGHAVIRDVYPLPWAGAVASKPNATTLLNQSPARTIRHPGRPGVVVAFDKKGLAALAERNGCLIELVPQVGDFVGTGAVLIRVHGGGNHIRDNDLCRLIALGQERTVEQDPAFAFRVIVDIAEKALSPAINDPTTGVQSIDQIQSLLQEVGMRDLNTGVVRGSNGKIRLVYRTPNWPDFVLLAIAEIRRYGKDSVQIMRRLRAMLEDLIAVLPPERVPLLQQQLDLLHVSVEQEFRDIRDREQAEIADSQGLGGSPTRAMSD